MRKILMLVLMVFFVAGLLSAEGFKIKTGPDKFAKIIYPASGNISLEEGSFEIWFKTGFDPNLNPKIIFYTPMTHLFVGTPKATNRISLISRYSYNKARERGGGELRLHGDIQKFGFGVEYENWQKGEWHYLAITWKNLGKKYHCQLYVNGELKKEGKMEPKKEMFLGEKSIIRIGAHYLNSCYATVDSIRISSVVRTPEELKKSFEEGLKWDRFTLLFDNFEHIDETDKKNVTTTTEKGKKGKIIGTYELVDTKFGKGIKLHVVEE